MEKINNKEWVLILTIFSIIMLGHFVTSAKPSLVDSVYDELVKRNVKHVDIVIKQCIKETGWFKCKVCSWKQHANPFGFRHKSKISKSNPKGYFTFTTWQDAVEFYEGWQKRKYKGGDYYKFLSDVGYATDPDYVKDLKLIVYERSR
jgi:hypothetical protein